MILPFRSMPCVPAARSRGLSGIHSRSGIVHGVGLAFATVAALLIVSCSGRGRYVAFTGYAQGGTYSVKINTSGVHVPREDIATAIDSILTLVDTTLSDITRLRS